MMLIWILRFVLLATTVIIVSCATSSSSSHRNSALTGVTNPSDLYAEMAAAYLQRGQIDAALERAQQALQKDGNNPHAHYLLAIIQQQLGQDQIAATHLTRAVELAPDDPELLNAWGVLLCKQGRYDEAHQQFLKALAVPLYKTPELAYSNAADCAFRGNKVEQSEQLWRQALTANPQFAPALFGLANYYYQQARYSDAREYMGRYARYGQASAKALLLAIRIEHRLGNKRNVKVLTQSLQQRFPDAPEIMALQTLH
jgi:type IV pilus assembly protein PilF